MQFASRLCHGLKSRCKSSRLLSCRTHRIPSRVPRILRLAASRIFACLPMMSGCPLPHHKSIFLLTSISPRLPLSVLHCRRRNSLFALSVMSDFLRDSRLQTRVSLPCRCHSRSHLLLTPPSLAFLELIKYPSYLCISRKSGRKLEFSVRLQVVQSLQAVMVAIASRTVAATRRTVSRRSLEPQTVASSRVEDHSCNRLEINVTSYP